MGIEYTDGVSIEAKILQLVKASDRLGSDIPVAWEQYDEWAVRYHLCPERSNLMRQFCFQGLDVLELGAGMGGITRHLAEQARSVHAVEGTEARFAVLQSRLHDLNNWTGEVANFQNIDRSREYDVVCLVGVLEYSELFVKAGNALSPFHATLELARQCLKDDGVLILAIENRLGLKYWSGCAEDHTARLFDGIAGYSLRKSPKTFSRSQLVSLLSESGFPRVDQFFPYPDYKVPTVVLSESLFLDSPSLASELANSEIYQHYGMPQLKYLPDYLVSKNLAESGMLQDFANSFLFVGSKKGESSVRQTLLGRYLGGEKAWHYNHNRVIPTRTTFIQTSDGFQVNKLPLTERDDSVRLGSGAFSFVWNSLVNEKLVKGVPVKYLLANHAYFGNWEAFEETFHSFLNWSFERWKVGYDYMVDGAAIDGIFTNAHLGRDGDYELFDLEWRIRQPFPKSWFIFRNVFNLSQIESLFTTQAPFSSFQELYERTCRTLKVTPDYAEDVLREATTQGITGMNPDKSRHATLLKGLFERAFPAHALPRNPILEAGLRNDFNRLQAENLQFHARMRTLPHRLAGKFLGLEKRFPKVGRFVGWPFEFVYQKIKQTRVALSRWRDSRHGFVVKELETTESNTLVYEMTPPGVEYPRGFLKLNVRGHLPSATSVKLCVSYRNDRDEIAYCNGKFAHSKTAAGGICNVQLDCEKFLLKISHNGEKPNIQSIKMKSLVRWSVGTQLVFSNLFSMMGSPKSFFGFLKRGFCYGKAAKLAGLRHWVIQEAKQSYFVVIDQYQAWIETCDVLTEDDRKKIAKRIRNLETTPLFSVVMPTYNTGETWLRSALDSVLAQEYSNWELCIADDASTHSKVKEVLREYVEKDTRIRVSYRDKNGHISEASNTALEMVRGDYVVLMDHDDELSDTALYLVAEELNAHPDAAIIYSDEDKIDTHGRRHTPHFKCEWDPEVFYSFNLLTHLCVFRTSLLREIGGFRTGYEGSQDYDLSLRAIAKVKGSQIRHIPRVLYHWRTIPGSVALSPGEKSYAHERARQAIRDDLEKKKIQAEVVQAFGSLHRVKYSLKEEPLVSVIIGTRDKVELLKTAVMGVLDKTDYSNVEILIVDNQSEKPETKMFLRDIQRRKNVRVLTYQSPFNFSAINNLAASQANGEVLLFLNNDIQVLNGDWLRELVSFAMRPEVGAVGARLLYPDSTVQHVGLTLGVHGIADHTMRGKPKDHPGYHGRSQVIRSVSAVSAACMAMRKDIFAQVGGFDEEHLKVAYNDVDLCLRVRNSGLRIVQNNHATLMHHESASRGSDQRADERFRFSAEVEYMKSIWGKQLEFDPFYSPNLTFYDNDCGIALPPRYRPPWHSHSEGGSNYNPTASKEQELDC